MLEYQSLPVYKGMLVCRNKSPFNVWCPMCVDGAVICKLLKLCIILKGALTENRLRNTDLNFYSVICMTDSFFVHLQCIG